MWDLFRPVRLSCGVIEGDILIVVNSLHGEVQQSHLD